MGRFTVPKREVTVFGPLMFQVRLEVVSQQHARRHAEAEKDKDDTWKLVNPPKLTRLEQRSLARSTRRRGNAKRVQGTGGPVVRRDSTDPKV